MNCAQWEWINNILESNYKTTKNLKVHKTVKRLAVWLMKRLE